MYIYSSNQWELKQSQRWPYEPYKPHYNINIVIIIYLRVSLSLHMSKKLWMPLKFNTVSRNLTSKLK